MIIPQYLLVIEYYIWSPEALWRDVGDLDSPVRPGIPSQSEVKPFLERGSISSNKIRPCSNLHLTICWELLHVLWKTYYCLRKNLYARTNVCIHNVPLVLYWSHLAANYKMFTITFKTFTISKKIYFKSVGCISQRSKTKLENTRFL